MRLNLAAMARQQGYRRKRTVFRPIIVPRTLSQELARILLDVPAIWANASPGINAAYAQALSQLQTDSARDVRVEIDQTGVRSTNIFAEITARIVRWVNRTEAWHRGKWVGLISPTGVDLSTVLHSGDVAETMETVIARNVALIRDVSAQAQGRISDIVFRGLQQRTPARVVAKEIRGAVDMARARSIRIASHQTQMLSASLDKERRHQVGIDRWIWVHSGKVNAREEHLERDGKEYTDETEPEDGPSELPNCACKAAPVLDMND